MRTGRWKDCSARASNPWSRAPPPARTNPAGIWPSSPARCKSSRIRQSNSMARGSMMSVSMCAKMVRGGRSPTLAISIEPFPCMKAEAAQPCRRLSLSASGMGVRKPTARSFVKWSPPIATELVCRTTPPPKTSISVVPPPMSSRQQPRSRSSCVRQDSAEARGSRTVSVMRMPALFAAVTRFCVAAMEEVTRWTFTSRRWPSMPMASRMPRCASTMNS